MVRATDHPPDISVWHDGGNSPTTKALIIHGAIDDAGALLAAEALTSTAETIVMPEAKARDSLARIVPDVIVVDEHLDTMSGREFLADTATSHPLAVRILLEHPSDGAGHPDTDGIAVVAKPVNRNALRALCRIAIDAAAWRSRALALEAENRSLRLVETHPTIGSLDDLDEVERFAYPPTRARLEAERRFPGAQE